MALVAVAATAQVAPVCVAGAVTTEAVLATESKAVRAVAAAVAAVAREIRAQGHTTAALPACPASDVLPWRQTVRFDAVRPDDAPGIPRLAARLLDLPPPAA